MKQIELNVHDWDKAEKEYESIQEEVDLLKTLQHTNIVGLVNLCLLIYSHGFNDGTECWVICIVKQLKIRS